MKDGFLRIACATTNIKVADCEYNSSQIIKNIFKSEKLNITLVAFPELCITAYTCGDLFLQEKLLHEAQQSLIKICKETMSLDIVAVVGVPIKMGAKLFNCAAVLYKGEILGLVPKWNIPNYREFYERRYFSQGISEGYVNIDEKEVFIGNRVMFACKNIDEFKFGVEICEDLWSVIPPSCYLARDGANIILNLSASNEYIGKAKYRRDLVKMQSSKLICAYAYASAGMGESSTDLVFSGHNIICENGDILAESKRFSTGIIYTDIDLKRIEHKRRSFIGFPEKQNVHIIYFDCRPTELKLCRQFSKTPFVQQDEEELNKSCSEILTLQSVGLETRISHVGCEKVVLGLSGGLDSTLAMLVCVRAFDNLKISRKGIIGVTMPCFGTSKRTYKNVKNLALAYGITLKDIPIGNAVKDNLESIGHSRDSLDIVYENVQVRERTQILMGIANKEKGLVIGTGDLSEIALGWTTYNGDHMSMYAVNASVPKTLVRHIIEYESMRQLIGFKNILDDILETPISPELLPKSELGGFQLTEKVVGPYELTDFFLYYFLSCGFSPSKIHRIASIAFKGTYKKDEIKKWLCVFLKRFFSNQFKRSCIPDSPKVSTISLSPRGDFRMPSDANVNIWLKEAENIEI